MIILGLETSCDETAAAVVEDGRRVRSNIIATQHELHERYAGVVPEIASRAHLERVLPVVREALREAGVAYEAIDAVAVGHRPGLIGSLLVGVSSAKALAWSLGVPVIGVDHVAAHLYAGLLGDAEPPPLPALGLVVSGGHTSLLTVRSPLEMTVVGRTIDDAVGEAFDKAATLLGLGYPGGPAVERAATGGNDGAADLPVSLLGPDSLDFSFSGLKTALLYAARGHPVGRGGAAEFPRSAEDLDETTRADLAASFQRAAISAVAIKVARALDRHPHPTLLVGGGVSANRCLRERLRRIGEERSVHVCLPPMEYCVDNAAMIAGLAAHRLEAGQVDDWTLAAAPGSGL